MRNFHVVHYSKLEDRKNNLITEFENYSYNLLFNTKFDKENINNKTLKRFNYHFLDKFIKRKPGFRKLKKSHISAWLKHIDTLLNNEEKDYVIVIEDDLILGENFEKNFALIFEFAEKVLPVSGGLLIFNVKGDIFLYFFEIKLAISLNFP